MQSSTGALCAILAFAIACVAVHGDQCTDGTACCSECLSCGGAAASCFERCISPCFLSQNCIDRGAAVANGVAVVACANAKKKCIPFEKTGGDDPPLPVVDLRTCCEILRGSCQGNAAGIPCTASDDDLVSCSQQSFQMEYQKEVAEVCNTVFCTDSDCANVISC